MLMVGSPGSGKTLLARALPGILPEMSKVPRSVGYRRSAGCHQNLFDCRSTFPRHALIRQRVQTARNIQTARFFNIASLARFTYEIIV
jgi:predicted ATPase with chaperone activity